jgi:AraC-like DNA-binding protein
MLLTRLPRPILRPFVETVWAFDESRDYARISDRERVLPTAKMHLVFRLSANPLRLFINENDATGQVLGHTLVGGARSVSYVRDVSTPSVSVGAQLLPGASELLFGVPASELAGRHTMLDDLVNCRSNEIRERLFEAQTLEGRLEILELFLATRLPRVHGLHPAVAQALALFNTTNDVREVVKETGYSHRRFIALFERSVGLTPKVYCRVRRFQRVLDRASSAEGKSWVDLALDEGYSDQSHLIRQFREFACITPSEYQRLSPTSPNHVPLMSNMSDML